MMKRVMTALAAIISISTTLQPVVASTLPDKSAEEDQTIQGHIDWATAHPDEGPHSPDACAAYGLMKASRKSKWQDRAANIDRVFPSFAVDCETAGDQLLAKSEEPKGVWFWIAEIRTNPLADYAIGVSVMLAGLLLWILARRSRPSK
jgi:hypothetical protein